MRPLAGRPGHDGSRCPARHWWYHVGHDRQNRADAEGSAGLAQGLV